jgi:hypothetical protein
MKREEINNKLRAIEKLAKKIASESTSQGTEYQKYTYALLKAHKIIENTN